LSSHLGLDYRHYFCNLRIVILTPAPYVSWIDSSRYLTGGGSTTLSWHRPRPDPLRVATYYIGVTGGPTDTVTITLAAAVLTADITLVTTVVDNPLVITLVATMVDNHLGYYNSALFAL